MIFPRHERRLTAFAAQLGDDAPGKTAKVGLDAVNVDLRIDLLMLLLLVVVFVRDY